MLRAGMWKALWGTSILPCSFWAHHSPQMSMCSQTQKCSKPFPLGFLWRPHYTCTDTHTDDLLIHRPLGTDSLLPTSPPRVGRTESSISLIMWLVPLATTLCADSPYFWLWSHPVNIKPGVVQRGLLWLTKDTFKTHYLGNSKCFRISMLQTSPLHQHTL